MLRMRTIKEAVAEIKEKDSKTAVTQYFLRQLVLSKKIPYVMSGGKYLINMDVLEDYLSGKLTIEENTSDSGSTRTGIPTKNYIRPVY